MSSKDWQQVKAARLTTKAAKDGYDRARRAFEVGERVRLLREEHGLSQRELATRIGSTQRSSLGLEAGGVTPRLGTLERIAEAWDTTLVIEFQPQTAPSSKPPPRCARTSAETVGARP